MIRYAHLYGWSPLNSDAMHSELPLKFVIAEGAYSPNKDCGPSDNVAYVDFCLVRPFSRYEDWDEQVRRF